MNPPTTKLDLCTTIMLDWLLLNVKLFCWDLLYVYNCSIILCKMCIPIVYEIGKWKIVGDTVNVEYFTVFKFSRIGKTAKIKTAKIKTERKIEPSEKWNQANYWTERSIEPSEIYTQAKYWTERKNWLRFASPNTKPKPGDFSCIFISHFYRLYYNFFFTTIFLWTIRNIPY